MSFDDFWARYPNRKGKGAARKSWEKLKPDDELAKKILLAIDAQKRYRTEAKGHGEFIPEWKHPSTWLNQECWEDEIPSHAKLKERHEEKPCGCGQPVTIGYMGVCNECYKKKVPHAMTKELNEARRKHKVNELKTPEEHLAYIKKMMGGMFK